MMTYNTPKGYNPHDYKKVRAFLEQTDNEGRKNGEKLSETYDPNDPTTWGKYGGKYSSSQRFEWGESDGELRIQEIFIAGENLYGLLDVSGCTALKKLECQRNNLISLNVSGCATLMTLKCSANSLTELNISGCTAFTYLYCYRNSLRGLDVSGCIALERLDCSFNKLGKLNVSGCNALECLECQCNKLKSLDVGSCIALRELKCYDNDLRKFKSVNNPHLRIWIASTEVIDHAKYTNKK